MCSSLAAVDSRLVVRGADLVADHAAEPEAETREEGQSEHVDAGVQDGARHVDADGSLVAEERQQAEQRERDAHGERRLEGGDGGQARTERIPALDDHPVDEAEDGAGPQQDLDAEFRAEAGAVEDEDADGGGNKAADEGKERTHGVVLEFENVFSAGIGC